MRLSLLAAALSIILLTISCQSGPDQTEVGADLVLLPFRDAAKEAADLLKERMQE